jgi:hypothetical protein
MINENSFDIMTSGAPEYLPIMLFAPVPSFTTLTVVVTVTGVSEMPVLPDEELRML